MRTLRQIRTVIGVLSRGRRNRLDFVRAIVRRPQLLVGALTYESALMLSASVEPRLKLLAEMRAATIVACEYCLDIGSALARYDGVTEQQMRDISHYRTSDAFDESERLVMELAEALTRVPAVVDDDLRARLEAAFAPKQITELVGVIAWENQRARFNQGMGIRPAGYSEGGYCMLPETAAASGS